MTERLLSVLTSPVHSHEVVHECGVHLSASTIGLHYRSTRMISDRCDRYKYVVHDYLLTCQYCKTVPPNMERLDACPVRHSRCQMEVN
jgi:hypothetical protein